MNGESTQSGNQAVYRVSSFRWFALVSLCGLGTLLGYIIAFPGIVGLIFTKYFNLDVKIVDWFTLCKSVSQVFFTVPIGIYAIANPLKVKVWLLIASLLFGIAFALISVGVIVKQIFWMIFVGMALAGVADTIFRSCVPLVAVSWFSDSAQGKLCGGAYACLGFGNAIAAITTAIFLNLSSSDDGVQVTANAIIFVNVSCCVIGVLLLLITWKYVSDSPPSPPSRAASQRLSKYSSLSNQLSFKKSAKRFLKETKILMTDISSVILVASYGIVLATLVIYFMMLPPLQDEQDNATISASKQKSYILICVTACNIIGSMLFGAMMDRIKSYRAIVLVIGVPAFCCSVAMFLSYYFSSLITLYVSTAVFTLFFFSFLPFVVGSLKQHCYLKVNEVTQTVVIIVVWNAITIILSQIYRVSISNYGGISFYVCNMVVCLIQIVLFVSIKPHVNRPVVECD